MKIKHKKSGLYIQRISTKKVTLVTREKATKFPKEELFVWKRYMRLFERNGLPSVMKSYEFED